jgi:hypothetical protein
MRDKELTMPDSLSSDTLTSHDPAGRGEGVPHPLVGTWRTVETSDAVQGGDTTIQQIQGYFIFTPAPDARLAVLYGSVDGPVGAAQGKGYQLAYTGTWDASGDSITVTIDFSTSPFINGSFQRYFAIDGTHLTLSTPIHESKASPGVMKVTSFELTR